MSSLQKKYLELISQLSGEQGDTLNFIMPSGKINVWRVIRVEDINDPKND